VGGKTEMKLKMLAALFLAAVATLAWAASAGAVDGTIEINQAKVMAAGGFPYVINSTNTSYRLTGSLTVSSTTADAIDVNVNHVTIDLNGFSINGPGGSISGDGINGSSAGALTVEDGSITGFVGPPSSGLVTGNNGIVRNVQSNANGTGITTGSGSVISGNTANNNFASGIICSGSGCVISGNTANGNSAFGIRCTGSGSLISNNTIDNNSGHGIFVADGTTGFGGNVMNGNVGGAFSGGTSLGAQNTNLCNGSAC
jgi:parallel beta-helix repeat protein